MRQILVAALFAAPCVTIAVDARAADALDAPLVAIVPPGGLTGGATARVHVLARDASGAGIVGLALQPAASEGRVSDWKAEGAGWYSFRFEAPSTTAAVDVELSVRGKGPAGPLDGKTAVPIHPANTGRIGIRAAPERLVLGRNDGATLSFQVEGGRDLGELDVRVSAGEVSSLTDVGGGRRTARFTAPAVNYPHLAILSAVARDGGDLIGVGQIPLQGAVQFPVDGPPGAKVLLRIGADEFGPVDLDASGKGAVPIIVSPGVGKATKVVVVGAKRTESELDLRIPETRRLALVPPGHPAEVGVGRVLHVVVRKPDGSPDAGASPKIAVDGGEAGPVRHVGDGLYAFTVTPRAAGDAKVTASIGEADIQRTELVLPVIAAFPEPGPEFVPPSASDGGVAHVVAVPRVRWVASDGKARVKVIVAATDAAGHPIPGAKLTLSTSRGAVPGAVTTDARGIAEVELVSARQTGLAELTVRMGERSTRTSVLFANQAIPGLVWPRSYGVQGRWEGLLAGSGEAAVAQADPDADPKSTDPKAADPKAADPTSADPDATGSTDAPDAAAIARLEVELPAHASPGGVARVEVRALTADDQPVPGATIAVRAEPGEVSDVSDLGGGRYAATVVLPSNATGELQVTAEAENAVTGRASVALDPLPLGVKALRPPKEPGAYEPSRLSAHVGFTSGAYAYAQRPSRSPGPLVDRPLLVGPPDGGPLAPLVGGEADLRAWIVPAFGVHTAFRATAYAIDAEAFTAPARDALFRFDADLVGRLPIRVGEGMLWFGVGAGFTVDDFMVFKGCFEPGCEVVYEPLVLPGLGLAGLFGLEVGRVQALAGFQQGLAFASVPYRVGGEFELGVALTEAFTVVLGADVVSRKLLVEGQSTGVEHGQLTDTQLTGSLGFGLRL